MHPAKKIATPPFSYSEKEKLNNPKLILANQIGLGDKESRTQAVSAKRHVGKVVSIKPVKKAAAKKATGTVILTKVSRKVSTGKSKAAAKRK